MLTLVYRGLVSSPTRRHLQVYIPMAPWLEENLIYINQTWDVGTAAAAPAVDDGSTGCGDVRFGGGERIQSDGRFGRRSEGAIRQYMFITIKLTSSWGVFLAAAAAAAAAVAHCVDCRNGDCWSSMNGGGVGGWGGGGGEAPVLEVKELEVHESPGVQLDGLLQLQHLLLLLQLPPQQQQLLAAAAAVVVVQRPCSSYFVRLKLG
ncbi:hypothetical protein BHE74_00007073 [Ensete ventricosum]|nr:hypothetical protein BHE74_00007073 [Ensete ventricosum]